MITVLVCAAALALWLTLFPGRLKRFHTARYVGLAVCALVLVLAGSVLMLASARHAGPNSITSSGLADLATSQAIQDVNANIVRVVCPRGTFAIGSEIICTADYRTRSQPLHVKLRANDDGARYVDVHVAS